MLADRTQQVLQFCDIGCPFQLLMESVLFKFDPELSTDEAKANMFVDCPKQMILRDNLLHP